MSILTLPRRRRNGAHPYPDLPAAALSATEAIAALPPEPSAPAPLPAPLPAPAFTPRDPAPTTPIRIKDPARPVRVPRHAPEAAPVLRRVAEALRSLDRPSPGTVLRADRDALPVFRAVARSIGWRAALPAGASARHVRWSTAAWTDVAMTRIAVAAETARAQARQRAAEWDAFEGRRRAAADVADISYARGDR